MEHSQKLQQISESATVALADRVRRLQAAGKNVIALQTGDPDFATPEPIVEAAYQALQAGLTHYASSRGLPELREAVSLKLAEEYGVRYDPEKEILITSGGIHAYFCALQAIINPGDEVLVPDPAWMTHANVAKLVGGRVKRVSSSPAHGFWPQMEDWERSLSSKVVALVINSPNNPTGSVAPPDYLRALLEFASRHDLYVISDEVYEAIIFDDRKHTCVASLPGGRERTLLVNSFSKTYAMTGWRIGYLAAPAPVISQALKASQYTITNVAPFVQQAAIRALTDPGVAAAVRKMVGKYQERRDLALALLKEGSEAGIGINEPQGAFYLFLDIHRLEFPAAEVAEQLLNETLIAMVPGSVYGACGEGFLRMTIGVSEEMIEVGLSGLLDWAGRHSGKSIKG